MVEVLRFLISDAYDKNGYQNVFFTKFFEALPDCKYIVLHFEVQLEELY